MTTIHIKVCTQYLNNAWNLKSQRVILYVYMWNNIQDNCSKMGHYALACEQNSTNGDSQEIESSCLLYIRQNEVF